jgi:hypothetical protein
MLLGIVCLSVFYAKKNAPKSAYCAYYCKQNRYELTAKGNDGLNNRIQIG